MKVFSRTRSLAAGGLLAVVLAMLLPSVAEAKPEPGVRNRGFRLFARSLGGMTINRVYLGLNSARGEIGVDSTNSSTIGGGFWPRGTPNQYVFNSGLQVAGKINNPGGSWHNDITGAFFFDPRGANANGDEVQPIYNFTNPDDAGAWPAAAIVAENNPADATYNTALLGLTSASQGDVWFMTWDGNPTLVNGRPHPLGIVVESRGLGWNYPSGNQDIVYFIFNFYNITSQNPADYASVRPDMRAILLEKAAEFKSRNEATFSGVTIPDGGYTIDSMFAAFAADMDVTSSAGTNFCSVNLPFAMGFCWERSFTQDDAGFYNDPTVYGAPFFAGPGFVGVKYLKSPTGAGEIQLFSNTTNGGAFPDADNVGKLFRYLSGNLSAAAGDNACLYNQVTDHICFINTVGSDARFYQSSTALSIPPGGYGTIVVAYIFAAPVAIPGLTPTGTTNITAGDPRRLVQEGSLQSGGANRIDSITGFRGFAGNGDGTVVQTEFQTVPNSLLNKALTAQLVFNNGFLLPFAPTPPNFYLIPGDNSVTVAWQPSVTESQGDPYFAVASNPVLPPVNPGDPPVANPAYDPNYRQFDVEGYRIYRGRVDAGTSLELLAQFDYGGTSFTDFTGQVQPTSQCGPEFVPPVTASCPVAFDYVQGSGVAPTASVDYPLVGEIVQIKLGAESRQLLANGDLFVFANVDTLLTGAGTQDGPFPVLQDNGVPFSFEDRSVRNNFRYFYAVTAFDVNSFQSGPATLESPRVTKAVTPVSNASNIAGLPALSFQVTGPNGAPYTQTPFTIDAQTGRFSGSPPPLGALQVRGVAFQGAQTLWPALGTGDLTATIDSVRTRADHEPYPAEGIGSFDCQGLSNGQGMCQEYYLTYRQPGKPDVHTRSVVYQPILTVTFGDDPEVVSTTNGAAVPFDDDQLARYGVPPGVGSLQASTDLAVGQYGSWTSGEPFYARRVYGAAPIGNSGNGPSPAGSRWFTGPNETLDHPAYSYRAGSLPGVDTIFAPLNDIWRPNTTLTELNQSVCMQVHVYAIAGGGRSADFEVTWGTGGAITVRDLTHNLPVPFNGYPGAGYGFVPDGNGNGVIDWSDFNYLEGMIQANNHLGFCTLGDLGLPDPGDGFDLSTTATAAPVSIQDPASVVPSNWTQTGTGFGLYIAGHWYIFSMTGGALPAPGTVWKLRTYAGDVRATDPGTTTPSNYTYTPKPGSPAVAGLTINYLTSGAATNGAVSARDLTNVHTVPDPYYITSGYEATTDSKVLQFVNLPSQAIIRIYTSSGILVNVLEANSQSFGGNLNWNLRNRNNQVVASGVYFYHVESGDARKVGRFTVVNFAQ